MSKRWLYIPRMNTETQKVMFSSASGNWITPPDFYKNLDEEFHFDFDPCPYPQPEWDGLAIEWEVCNYVNPPYGRELWRWVLKAHYEWKKGKTVVMLLPARTDTKWFHTWILGQAEIRFIKGRL